MEHKGLNLCEKEYEILFRDIDENYNCRLTSIMDFLGDIALVHGEQGGIDFIKENADGIAQVFLDCKVIINRYPRYREKIKVTTYVESLQKFYATRRYIAKDSNGEIVFDALALAVTIDMKRRRLTKIPERYYEIYGVEKKEFKKPERLEIKHIDNKATEKIFKIRQTDRDSNKHVNNVRYIEWAMNAIEDERLIGYEVSEMNIKFEKEMQKEFDVKINAELIELENGFKTIYNFFNSLGEEVNTMEFIWRKK
ncbi:MAG: acyl-[acyl-carrier-protein] thioesterase [Sarcina sp.]